MMISGRIINMETQNVKFSEWQEDIPVDASVWREAARYSMYSLNIIRIFLEVGTGHVTRIGNFFTNDQVFENVIILLLQMSILRRNTCLEVFNFFEQPDIMLWHNVPGYFNAGRHVTF